jgi:hypothetical protein
MRRDSLDSVLIGEPDDCWPSTNAPNNGGYVDRVHRAVARDLYGDIDGREVHHTCLSRNCHNPAHITVRDIPDHKQEHVDLRTTCFAGHDLTDPANVHWWRGNRWCRPCDAERRRRYRRGRKG